jgi:hypothetical protein
MIPPTAGGCQTRIDRDRPLFERLANEEIRVFIAYIKSWWSA